MEANDFISKLKTDDSEKCNSNLRKHVDEYKAILSKLPAKDRGIFSLNVLRTLCWNLDKAPSWRDRIDNQALLTLSIDCIRETRLLDKDDRVKTLACIYHLHRHVVKQSKPVTIELVFKISYMPFELETKHLLQEYNKTYWNILADRLSYIERLKTKVNIIKLLPKLTEDISKVIEIYDTVQFCSTILVFVIKKLHFLYNETNAKELSQTFGQIFTALSKKDDLKLFKKLTEKDTMELYRKLTDCLYVIAENASKVNFKDCMLDSIVCTCISLVGHRPDLFHCLQTFYLNSFCSLLSLNTNLSYTETVLVTLQQSLETTEKLGYIKAMLATYPYLSQLLRLYIEYNVTNCTKKPWKHHFNIQIQENCLKLILLFMDKLKNCEQLLKCENCRLKSGLHDSLRLSLLIKHFVTVSLSQNILLTSILETFYTIITEEYKVVTELKKQGCVNYQKFFRKLQTDIHNTAISLNKAQYFEFSIKLFDIYLKHELECTELDYKNISRALFNKSICELDCRLYEKSVIDAFLSLMFSQKEGLETDKYMSLVMDIKAKELKSKSSDDAEDVEMDTLQLVSVLDACKMALESKLYGDLQPFLTELKFCTLLKHEFQMYAKLWPSIAPIGGVWRSLHELLQGNSEHWISDERKDILHSLHEVILETPSAVRTIHSGYYSDIVADLLEKFDDTSQQTTDSKLVHAALLFLQFEYDLAAASKKYGWKSTEPLQSMDPDQIPANRTIPQEHAATKHAIVALQLLTDLLPNIEQCTNSCLHRSLQIYQIFVPLLLHLCRDVEGMQLAYICCRIADIVDDGEAYIRNAGTLLSSSTPNAALDRVCARAVAFCGPPGGGGGAGGGAGAGGEAALVFICDVAIYYSSQGALGAAARLVQLAQSRIMRSLQLLPDVNLDLAVGRLLEAQTSLCKSVSGPSSLTAVNATHRHYLAISVTGSKWSFRRLRTVSVRMRSSAASLPAARVPRALRLRARARGAGGAALTVASAPARGRLYAEITDVASFDDAQIRIDNRLKHVLGLQPSNEVQPYYATESRKEPPFTPKQDLETMLDNMVLKKAQISPSLPCTSVPAFKIPTFFNHSSGCSCYACDIPLTLILACKTSGLEASVYAKANETEIAKNYFEGVQDMITITYRKLQDIAKKYKEIYEDFIVDSVVRSYECELKVCELEVLMELSFFELNNKNFEQSDEYIVRIHELIQEIGNVDQYLQNEVMNLMVASAQLKKIIKKPEEVDLEEFESLRLSPVKNLEPPKTPVTKPAQPPKLATKMIVKDEELPKKRKVIKLNLEDDEKDFEKPSKSLTRGVKKDGFKIPNPITSKPVLEIATPRPSRSKPAILVTQPSEDMATPKTQLNKTKDEFFTPLAPTPEQFFTPMTQMRTYSKKSLQKNLVKKLEQDFSTPKTGRSLDKENMRKGENSVVKEEKSLVKGENSMANKENSMANKENSAVKEEKSQIKRENSMANKENSVVKEEKSLVKGENSMANKENSAVKEEKSLVKGENSMTDKESCIKKDTLNVPSKSVVKKESKKKLIRAVSPGKLCKGNKERDNTIRSRRMRKPVKLSLDEDDNS